MNRREFSAGAACVLGDRGPGPAGRPVRPGQEAARKARTTCTLDKRVTGRGAAGQDRGDRVLLVQLPALQRLRAPAGGLDQEAAADVVFRRVPVPFATTSCRSSACTTRWRPWASSTNCTARCSSHPRRTASRSTGKTPILALGRQATAWTRPSSRSCTTPSRCPARRAAPRSCRTPTRCEGVPAHGHRRPLLHRRRPGRQHGPRAAGRRLPGRRSAQGQVATAQPRACVAAADRKARASGLFALALRYNAQQDSCLYETHPTLPCPLSLALALAGARRPAPRRPTATSP